MAIHYVVRKKIYPDKIKKAINYHPVIKSLPAVNQKTFVEDMVKNTGMSRGEARALIDYLFESLVHYISLGHTVVLDDIGYFKVTLETEGSESPEKVCDANVKRKRLRFYLTKSMRDKINSIPIEKFQK